MTFVRDSILATIPCPISYRSNRLLPPFDHPGSASGHNRCNQAWIQAAIGVTIFLMLQVGLFAMHVLEVMFFVGMAGSAIVVVISFVEDAQELFGDD